MVNKECTTDYKGSKIAFCCGKAESAEEKVALLFQDAVFARGFEVKKPE